jgi:CzcA family heavy metal efflux pump
MLRWVLGFSLQFRYLVLVAAAALMAFGLYRLRDAPVDVLPEFSAPVIQIQTEALGLSAAEMEDLVTLNQEEILAGVSWLKTIRSKTVTGLSSILLVFEPGTDIMRARQLVQERLNLAHALPNISKPPVMLQPLSTTSRAMIVGLSPKGMSLIDTSVLARWTITPKLLGVPGVANVSIWGLRGRQLQARVDPQRLRDRGVTLNTVIKTAGDAMWVSPLSFLEASTIYSGGWIDTPNQRLGVQHIQPISTPDDLAKVAVADKPLRLADVATVVEAHPPLIGDAVINNEPGLLLVIEKFPYANTREVVRGVNAALDELRQGLPGIDIDSSIFQATSFMDLSFDNLSKALLIGAGLLVLVLGAWLSTSRALLVSIVAIALSLVAAGLVLYLRGTTINAMVLAGLAIALAVVIDDAVVDVENIMRRLRQHRSRGSDRSTAEIIFEACIETRTPLIYATLILVLAVTPLFLLGGQLGAFLSPLAVSFVLALLVSTVVGMTVTPALAMALLRGASLDHREPPLVRWCQRLYDAALPRIVGAPQAASLIAGAVVLAGLAALPLMSWSLLPSFKERDVRVSWKEAPGTSLPAMGRIVTQAANELRQLPGIRNVSAHIGRAITGDQVVGVNSAQLWINIAPGADHGATLAAIRQTVQAYPGFDGDVQTYLTDKVKELLPESGAPIMVRIQGPEREVLRREAEKMATVLSRIPGLVNPRVEHSVETPHVQVKVDLAAAARVGLKPGDVRRAVATVFAGLEVGNLYEQQKVFEVVVWGVPRARHDITSVRELLIDTPDDGHVRLADVADVRVMPTPAVIEREGVSRGIDIRADVAERSVDAVRRDVREQVQKIAFPLDYHAMLLGDYEEQWAARWRMLIAALAAAIGIYLLLQACFQSWRLASLLFASLLAAPAGSVLATLAAGGTVSLGSVAAGLAVLGIAVRQGIWLLHRYQSLEREEGEVLGQGLVLRGARERIGPILTSATAVGAAVLPLVALGNIAGLEILHPMAVAILGGLVTSAFMSLFVIPALYLRFASPQPRPLPEMPAGYGSERHG